MDSHVAKWARALGWVPESAKTNEEVRLTLEHIIPRNLWHHVNPVLCSLGQLTRRRESRLNVLYYAIEAPYENVRVMLDKAIRLYNSANLASDIVI